MKLLHIHKYFLIQLLHMNIFKFSASISEHLKIKFLCSTSQTANPNKDGSQSGALCLSAWQYARQGKNMLFNGINLKFN